MGGMASRILAPTIIPRMGVCEGKRDTPCIGSSPEAVGIDIDPWLAAVIMAFATGCPTTRGQTAALFHPDVPARQGGTSAIGIRRP